MYVYSAQEKRSIGDQNSPRPQGSKPKSPGRLHASTRQQEHTVSESDAQRTTNESKTTPRIRISSRPAVEPRGRGAAGEPDRPVGVRRGAHGERRPGRLGGLPQQRLAAEEGRRRRALLPIPGERRDGGGGGRGGGDECH